MVELIKKGRIPNTRNKLYIIDTADELAHIEADFGNEAYCIADKVTYICGGDGEYIEKKSSEGGGATTWTTQEIINLENKYNDTLTVTFEDGEGTTYTVDYVKVSDEILTYNQLLNSALVNTENGEVVDTFPLSAELLTNMSSYGITGTGIADAVGNDPIMIAVTATSEGVTATGIYLDADLASGGFIDFVKMLVPTTRTAQMRPIAYTGELEVGSSNLPTGVLALSDGKVYVGDSNGKAKILIKGEEHKDFPILAGIQENGTNYVLVGGTISEMWSAFQRGTVSWTLSQAVMEQYLVLAFYFETTKVNITGMYESRSLTYPQLIAVWQSVGDTNGTSLARRLVGEDTTWTDEYQHTYQCVKFPVNLD